MSQRPHRRMRAIGRHGMISHVVAQFSVRRRSTPQKVCDDIEC